MKDNRAFVRRSFAQGFGATKVAGIEITHPDKLWWDTEQISKLEVANYYSDVAPRILPWLNNRLLTVQRCPDGIKGNCFFEKNFSKNLPGVPTHAIQIQGGGKTIHYVVGGSPTTLLSLVNLGCITIHVMNSKVGSLDLPDWLAFDLDPSTGMFVHAVHAARILRQLLDEMKIRSFPKTTGGRGLHILVPLQREPAQNQEMVRHFARSVCEKMARMAPATVTVQMRKVNRGNQVFADWLRNAFGQTIVAPYSVRCRPGAPVSTPLDWDELDPELSPLQFNIRTIHHRLKAADPWADFWQFRQTLRTHNSE